MSDIQTWKERLGDTFAVCAEQVTGPMESEIADLRARVEDYADEINKLRNVIQAACIGGTDMMLSRWVELFPDAPVPTVQASALEDAARLALAYFHGGGRDTVDAKDSNVHHWAALSKAEVIAALEAAGVKL